MLRSVRVPAAFEPPFARAEKFVEQLFADIQRAPEKGTIHVGGDRYVMIRAESLYLSWFDALSDAFGEEAAREFIYKRSGLREKQMIFGGSDGVGSGLQ
jgi:son of sevenless-like protein